MSELRTRNETGFVTSEQPVSTSRHDVIRTVRLRLWLEEGRDPRLVVQHTFIHVVARAALAIVLADQGAVPKLAVHHVDEMAIMEAAGVPASLARSLVIGGRFDVEWRPVTAVPSHILPTRQEYRD